MTFVDKGFRGVDVSFWQGNPNQNMFIDFAMMKPLVDFVIIKVGQRDYADPAFGYNWKAAGEELIPRGAYWFLDDERDGKFQAEFFWNLIKHDPGEGPLVVDYEWGSGTSWQRVWDFLVRLEELSKYPKHRAVDLHGLLLLDGLRPQAGVPDRSLQGIPLVAGCLHGTDPTQRSSH